MSCIVEMQQELVGFGCESHGLCVFIQRLRLISLIMLIYYYKLVYG